MQNVSRGTRERKKAPRIWRVGGKFRLANAREAMKNMGITFVDGDH